jgi:valyl-tRNA synthetase
MKAVELDKVFNPADFEDRIYKYWMDNDLFSPKESEDPEKNKNPFTIVIPPPNVTGVLHMGHGLNNTLQDILIRYYRMTGRPTLWLPGTDHAGIATQNIVEKQLRAKGLSRRDLGREKFLEETWKVKDKHHSIITKQLQKIGASCDWKRERFTLDDGLSKAVRDVFVSLFEKNLIYKGKYLVNWCTSCGTALSDDEVEHSEEHGALYHIYYPLADGSGRIEIATTRPETMFGDTAIAVHPEDERYAAYIGKEVLLPLTERKFKIIADSYVDKEFGSGALKITPGHDPNDWEIGNRHNLERINILNEDGTLNENVPIQFRGMKCDEARKLVIKTLTEQNYLIDKQEHNHQVGHCYRCNTVIEPFMSEQWFVSMKKMAEKAMNAWEKDEVRFFPKKWENTYKHWLNGIRDWCISRQLWWGHRIPVWYCLDCDEMMVSKTDVLECKSCGSKNLKQDEDVLDTWFSSWLWPFSTLGWPEQSADFERYFPTSTLVTGYDILFFWVARMIMASEEFFGQVPFRDIYLTGLVRDKKGRKMSKSLGNGLDPLEIVNEFGADAMKFTLVFLAAQGQDILIDKDAFKFGSKFANKIWNATRYMLMNLKDRTLLTEPEYKLENVDKWIYHKLNLAAGIVKSSLENYRFNDAAQIVYEFFWNDLCDWYLEASKLNLYSNDEFSKNRAITILINLLEESLRLLHPFLSFITEEIYQKLPNSRENIITAPYPEKTESRNCPEVAEKFELLQDLIRGIRTIRSEFTITPERKIPIIVSMDEDFTAALLFEEYYALIKSLTKASELTIQKTKPDTSGSIPVPGKGFEAFIYISDIIDIPVEISKLKKEEIKNNKLLESTERKLGNSKFLDNAPDDVVDKEKEKLNEFKERSIKISEYLKQLQKD